MDNGEGWLATVLDVPACRSSPVQVVVVTGGFHLVAGRRHGETGGKAKSDVQVKFAWDESERLRADAC